MPKLNESQLSERREHIIDAALECFSRRGFGGTTIPDILREANVSTGALYTYFTSKEDIVDAVVERWRQWRSRRFQRTRHKASVWEGLDTISEIYVGPAAREKYQHWMRLAVQLWGEAEGNTRIDEILRHHWKERHEHLVTLIRSGMESRQIKLDLDADSVAKVLVATYMGIILHKVREPDVDVNKLRDALHRVWWNGLSADTVAEPVTRT